MVGLRRFDRFHRRTVAVLRLPGRSGIWPGRCATTDIGIPRPAGAANADLHGRQVQASRVSDSHTVLRRAALSAMSIERQVEHAEPTRIAAATWSSPRTPSVASWRKAAYDHMLACGLDRQRWSCVPLMVSPCSLVNATKGTGRPL